MAGGTESQQCPISIIVNGEQSGDLGSLVSPWPEIKMLLDDTFDSDVEQYDQPPELRLLFDEKQLPTEIQEILFNSLQDPEVIVAASQQPKSTDEQVQNSKTEEVSGHKASSKRLSASTSEYQSHSPSTSTTSLALSTVPTSGSSDGSVRQASKKHTLSALVSSTAKYIGSVKHAIKDSPTNKKAKSAKSRNLGSECASCLEEISTRKMFNLQCKHSYCRECFTTLITTAMQTESLFPPKCCLIEIPLNEVVTTLDRNQKEVYKAKAAEYSLKPEARWYCPNASCGKWIPPSKLHRLRILGARCPSCDTKICGYCRGMSHEAGVDCPEDFGLEATLEEAERQGWRRCYKCRALVELTTGCRHITCKCKAQFCYTCGAKWRTCTCSEVDQQRRQEEIVERQNARAARSREEEEEIARAIAAVDAMERRAAEERAREAEERERREALRRANEAKERRRREHLERLEAEKKRRDEEEAARRREEAMRISVTERVTYLRGALLEVQQFQQSTLISRHNSETTALTEEARNKEAIIKTELETFQIKLISNSATRQALLQSEQQTALADLTTKHEEEEDETFLSLQEHLRGKPNREARLKTLMDKLEQRQKEDMDRLIQGHDAELKYLENEVALEKNALDIGYALRSADQTKELNDSMTRLRDIVMAERRWFEIIAERRGELIEELERRLWMDIGVELPRRVSRKQKMKHSGRRAEEQEGENGPSTAIAITASDMHELPVLLLTQRQQQQNDRIESISQSALRSNRRQKQAQDDSPISGDRDGYGGDSEILPQTRTRSRSSILSTATETKGKTKTRARYSTTRMDDVMFGSLLL